MDITLAIEKIKQNSRIYSRKQMTWFKRDEEIHGSTQAGKGKYWNTVIVPSKAYKPFGQVLPHLDKKLLHFLRINASLLSPAVQQ